MNGRVWLEERILEVLRGLAENPGDPHWAATVIDSLEAQERALLATGALAPEENPVPRMRRLLAERGFATSPVAGAAEPPPEWVEILDRPAPDPQLVAVVPVLWNPQVLPRGRLTITTLEHWSDGLRLTFAAVGTHAVWRYLDATEMSVADHDGTNYSPGGSAAGNHGALTTVSGHRSFHPAPSTDTASITISVSRGRNSFTREVALRD